MHSLYAFALTPRLSIGIADAGNAPAQHSTAAARIGLNVIVLSRCSNCRAANDDRSDWNTMHRRGSAEQGTVPREPGRACADPVGNDDKRTCRWLRWNPRRLSIDATLPAGSRRPLRSAWRRPARLAG